MQNPFKTKKPTFGDWEQIKFLKLITRIREGKEPFHQLHLMPVIYNGGTRDDGRPKYYYENWGTCNSVFDLYTCPFCFNWNYIIRDYDPQEPHQQQILTIESDLAVLGFKCDHCEKHFRMNDHNNFYVWL